MASAYSHIDSSEGEIRLLVVEPAANHGDPLVCSLLPAFLPLKPQFKALSYTWGMPGLISDIQLNGEPFPIQENAAAALRRLRHQDKTRTVWIDAICINQTDIHEKEGQLVLMRSIYEQAEQVCVWLGEPTESTEIAIQDLQSTVGMGVFSTTEKSVINNYMATLTAPSHPFRNITNGVAWQWSTDLDLELSMGDFRELLSRPWWSRVWIIQEAVVCGKVVFMIGGDTIAWENIERSLERIWKGRVLQQAGAVQIFGVVVNPELYAAQDETFQLISRLRTAWHAGSFGTSIYELLYEFRQLQCTNQRDRVFGCLGLARAGGEFLDIQPDYSSPTRDVFIKSALSIINSKGALDILNCVREWRGVEKPLTPSYAFSLPDQAKYHDVGAMVSDGPGTKPRRGWQRLPQGWERMPVSENTKIGGLTMLKTMWKGKNARYYDHNTSTTHEHSPLKGKEPQLCRHPALHRELPPGWVKIWDNLGRAVVHYSPSKPNSPPAGQPAQPSDLLDSLPSWVPNWSAITHLDPHPLLDWSDTAPRYNACASTPATAIPNGNTLTVEGVLFDTILAVSAPWHPTSPIITRTGAPVLTSWETLALDTTVFSPYPCPYTLTSGGRAAALWRTHIADSTNQVLTAVAETTRPLVNAWYDRSGWSTQLPTLAEMSSKNLWEASSAEIDVKYQHWDLHGELRRAEGYDFSTKGTDERYAELIKRIHDACAHRVLFVTKKGYMGLGPWNAKVGDAVCVLKGGKTPFLLRGADKEGCHALVGEGFVQGIMGGEGMSGEMRMFCLV